MGVPCRKWVSKKEGSGTSGWLGKDDKDKSVLKTQNIICSAFGCEDFGTFPLRGRMGRFCKAHFDERQKSLRNSQGGIENSAENEPGSNDFDFSEEPSILPLTSGSTADGCDSSVYVEWTKIQPE